MDRLCLLESFDNEHSRACKDFLERILSNGTNYFAVTVKSFQEESRRECTYIRTFLTQCMDRKTKHSLVNIALVSPEYHREMRGPIELRGCEELSGDSENINTSILNGLKNWVQDEEKTHKSHNSWSGVEIEFKTLAIDGNNCTE